LLAEADDKFLLGGPVLDLPTKASPRAVPASGANA